MSGQGGLDQDPRKAFDVVSARVLDDLDGHHLIGAAVTRTPEHAHPPFCDRLDELEPARHDIAGIHRMGDRSGIVSTYHGGLSGSWPSPRRWQRVDVAAAAPRGPRASSRMPGRRWWGVGDRRRAASHRHDLDPV